MKKRYLYFVLLILSFGGIISCSDMNDMHQEYLDKGEQIYLGKVDTVIAYPGYDRLKLKCVVKADPKITKLRVTWNEGQDELIVPFVRQNPEVDTIKVNIDPLPENSYLFKLNTIDDNNNSSIVTEFTTDVFGEKYSNKLVNKSIEGTLATPSVFYVQWKPNVDAVSVKVIYTDVNGVKQTVLTPESELITELNNWKPGSTIEYQTEFKPHENSIDPFFALAETMELPADFQLDKSRFNIVTLPFDVEGNTWGGSIANLWNDVIGGDFMHTGNPEDPMPQHITFDTGVLSNLSRLRIDPRTCCFDALPRIFEIWGIDNIEGAATEVNSDDPGWESDMLNKGWTKLKRIELPLEQSHANGQVSMEFADDLPSVRYIRMYFIENMTDASKNYVHASEATFYATKIH